MQITEAQDQQIKDKIRAIIAIAKENPNDVGTQIQAIVAISMVYSILSILELDYIQFINDEMAELTQIIASQYDEQVQEQETEGEIQE